MMRSVALILTVFALPLASQDFNGQTTSQMLNGRGWLVMNSAAKVFYMTGLHDAIIAEASVFFRPVSEVTGKWAERFVVVDYVKELDDLYRHRENGLLPAPVAVDYCTAKFKGTSTKADLE
jgi:hypothetical protein